MHNILDEFEFRPDQTTDYRVSCPCASEKNSHRLIMGKTKVITFSRLFLIGSFSYLQVVRTYIKAEFEFPTDPTTDYGVSCP